MVVNFMIWLSGDVECGVETTGGGRCDVLLGSTKQCIHMEPRIRHCVKLEERVSWRSRNRSLYTLGIVWVQWFWVLVVESKQHLKTTTRNVE